MSPDPKPTEIVLIERMEFIERENRRLRSAGRAMLVGMAIVLGITVDRLHLLRQLRVPGCRATSPPGSSPSGMRRARAAAPGASRTTARCGFILSDQSGRPRVRVSLFQDGSSGVSLADTADRKLVVLGALPDQSTSFVMSDHAGVPRAVLGMSANGSANLVFADRDGATKAGLGVDGRGQGSFTLADRARPAGGGARARYRTSRRQPTRQAARGRPEEVGAARPWTAGTRREGAGERVTGVSVLSAVDCRTEA